MTALIATEQSSNLYANSVMVARIGVVATPTAQGPVLNEDILSVTTITEYVGLTTANT